MKATDRTMFRNAIPSGRRGALLNANADLRAALRKAASDERTKRSVILTTGYLEMARRGKKDAQMLLMGAVHGLAEWDRVILVLEKLHADQLAKVGKPVR